MDLWRNVCLFPLSLVWILKFIWVELYLSFLDCALIQSYCIKVFLGLLTVAHWLNWKNRCFMLWELVTVKKVYLWFLLQTLICQLFSRCTFYYILFTLNEQNWIMENIVVEENVWRKNEELNQSLITMIVMVFRLCLLS